MTATTQHIAKELLDSTIKTLNQHTIPSELKAHAIEIVTEKIAYSLDEKEERLASFVVDASERKLLESQKAVPISQSLTTGITVEEHICFAENEILFKRENAFFMMQHEREKRDLSVRQEQEARSQNILHADLKNDLLVRSRNKAFREKQLRFRKLKDLKLLNQQLASRAGDVGKVQLAEKRDDLDKYVVYTQQKHEKRLKRQEVAHKRQLKDKVQLEELEIKELNLTGESKNERMHNFQFHLNHQKALDKQESEHMREIHFLDITFIRSLGDIETRMIDQMSNLHIGHLDATRELEEVDRIASINEKFKIKEAKDLIKKSEFAIIEEIERRKIVDCHNIQTLTLLQSHSVYNAKRNAKWSPILKRQLHEPATFKIPTEADHYTQNVVMVDNLAKARQELKNLQQGLVKLSEIWLGEMKDLTKQQHIEYAALEEQFLFRILELETRHEVDFAKAWIKQRTSTDSLLVIQHHELEMESQVRAAESQALFERRVLNTLLDSISDGVVTITPAGTINRFNAAAQSMFEYPASYAIGKNIKLLMDATSSSKHDDHIFNYLDTDIKKVIGKGRRTLGQKKSGESFPIHLSISEVKGDGYHIFTGIINDLTEQVRIKNAIKAEEDRKKKETQVLLDSLAVYQNRSTKLLEQMLPGDFAHRIMKGETPPPMAYDSCTIFFSDIVGFTSIASAASAMDVVNLLNDLYTYFDAVIDRHDCYKVETIGDAYMVVSGVPNLNGEEHAGQIADMALHLLHGIYEKIIVRHTGKKLQIRIGLHTGACVAGIVGVKMPRYCLFGNTVNFASLMESSGSPMRIQCSDTTFQILKRTGNYICQERDHPTEFGTGWIKTYWIFRKEGLDLSLPNPDDWPVLAHKKG